MALANQIIPERECTKCKKSYSRTLEHFPPHKKTKDGMGSWCRNCNNQAKRDRYQKNPDRYRQYTAEYRQQNYEATIERTKNWRARNPEYHTLKAKEWNENHPGASVEYARQYRIRFPNYAAQWAKANREKVNARTRRYRTRKLNAPGSHTGDDVLKQLASQKNKCWWCSKDLGDEWHVDHVIPLSRSGSNSPENLVIACPPCNHSKSNKLPQEWCGRLF